MGCAPWERGLLLIYRYCLTSANGKSHRSEFTGAREGHELFIEGHDNYVKEKLVDPELVGRDSGLYWMKPGGDSYVSLILSNRMG